MIEKLVSKVVLMIGSTMPSQEANIRNNRYIAKSLSDVKRIFRTKQSAQVMFLGVVASDGKKMALHYFKLVEKVGEIYYKALRHKILP